MIAYLKAFLVLIGLLKAADEQIKTAIDHDEIGKAQADAETTKDTSRLEDLVTG